MLEFALAIGAYSYLILFLGLLGKLYFLPVVLVSIGFWGWHYGCLLKNWVGESGQELEMFLPTD